MSYKVKSDEQYEHKPFRVPKYRARFDGFKNLSDVPNLTWFTPAMLYRWGRFSDLQLSDVVTRLDLKIFWYTFNRPIFRGLEIANDAGWNHTLWAVEQPKWNQLVDEIVSMIQVNTQEKCVLYYAMQELEIFDPLRLDDVRLVSPAVPRMQIGAFAVQTDKFRLAFLPPALDGSTLPMPRRLKPQAARVIETRKILASRNDTSSVFEACRRSLLETQDAEFEAKKQEFLRKHGRRP